MKAFLKWFFIGIVVVVIVSLVLMAINTFLPAGWKLSQEVFAVLTGIALSIFWTYFPNLRVQFAGLPSHIKSLVNLILMILIAAVMFTFTCIGWAPIAGVVCTVEGAKALIVLIFLATVGNQITYTASPQPADVKEAKYFRAG